MNSIPRVVYVRVCGPTSLELAFADGVRKRVNIGPLLEGRVFEPLHDPAYFRKAAVDPIGATVVWPNGADIAPETLYELPEEAAPSASAVKPPSR
jgi:hypothetical protein